MIAGLNIAGNGVYFKEDISSMWEYVCMLPCFEVKISAARQALQKTARWDLS